MQHWNDCEFPKHHRGIFDEYTIRVLVDSRNFDKAPSTTSKSTAVVAPLLKSALNVNFGAFDMRDQPVTKVWARFPHVRNVSHVHSLSGQSSHRTPQLGIRRGLVFSRGELCAV